MPQKPLQHMSGGAAGGHGHPPLSCSSCRRGRHPAAGALTHRAGFPFGQATGQLDKNLGVVPPNDASGPEDPTFALFLDAVRSTPGQPGARARARARVERGQCADMRALARRVDSLTSSDQVMQLVRLNPFAFEFSEDFLAFISDHVVSGLFGTFVGNSAKVGAAVATHQ